MAGVDDSPRGFDVPAAAMTLVTLVALSWAAWLRFGPAAHPEPPAVGKTVPSLHLLDPATSEPLVLLGLRGKVVWISFWSAAPPNGTTDLAALGMVWKRLKPHAKFAMAAAAEESDRPDLVRATVASAKADMPAYLAPPETLRAFGVRAGRLPLHVLLDPSGRVVSIAQGRDPATLSRLVDQAEQVLDEIEPLGKSRFAGLFPDGGGSRRVAARVQPASSAHASSSAARSAAAALRGNSARTTAPLTATRRAPASITSSMFSSPIPPMANQGSPVAPAAWRTKESPAKSEKSLVPLSKTGPTPRYPAPASTA